MQNSIKDKTAIVGIGETAFAKHLEPSETELACLAIRDALDDAGIDPSEVVAVAERTAARLGPLLVELVRKGVRA